MYTLERANLIVPRTMDSQCYLNTVRQQNRGVVEGGDNADVNVNMNEEGEEEHVDVDPPLPDESADLMQVVTRFRNGLNSCLEREQWSDATILQSGVMRALNLANQYWPITAELLRELLNGLASSLEPLVRRHRATDPNLAERYAQYMGQLRDMTRT